MALRLVYFPVRAKAECIRMALRYGKVEYEDVSVSDHFGCGWGAGAKAMAPFNQLPILVVGDAPPLAQSGSIMRYLAGLTGLEPDPADALMVARCDAVFEASQELAAGDSNVNPIVNVFRGEQFEEKKATFFGMAPAKIANLAKQLELCSGGAGPFFFGAKPLYCDLSVYRAPPPCIPLWPRVLSARYVCADVLSNTLLLDATALDAHPGLQTFMGAVEALPGVAEYLAERPDCVDIGTSPMLKAK